MRYLLIDTSVIILDVLQLAPVRLNELAEISPFIIARLRAERPPAAIGFMLLNFNNPSALAHSIFLYLTFWLTRVQAAKKYTIKDLKEHVRYLICNNTNVVRTVDWRLSLLVSSTRLSPQSQDKMHCFIGASIALSQWCFRFWTL